MCGVARVDGSGKRRGGGAAYVDFFLFPTLHHICPNTIPIRKSRPRNPAHSLISPLTHALYQQSESHASTPSVEQTRVRCEWKRVAPSKEECEVVEKNVALMLVWHVFLCNLLRLCPSVIVLLTVITGSWRTVSLRDIDLIFCGSRINQSCLANLSDTVPVQVRLTAGHQLVLSYYWNKLSSQSTQLAQHGFPHPPTSSFSLSLS